MVLPFSLSFVWRHPGWGWSWLLHLVKGYQGPVNRLSCSSHLLEWSSWPVVKPRQWSYSLSGQWRWHPRKLLSWVPGSSEHAICQRYVGGGPLWRATNQYVICSAEHQHLHCFMVDLDNSNTITINSVDTCCYGVLHVAVHSDSWHLKEHDVTTDRDVTTGHDVTTCGSRDQ